MDPLLVVIALTVLLAVFSLVVGIRASRRSAMEQRLDSFRSDQHKVVAAAEEGPVHRVVQHQDRRRQQPDPGGQPEGGTLFVAEPVTEEPDVPPARATVLDEHVHGLLLPDLEVLHHDVLDGPQGSVDGCRALLGGARPLRNLHLRLF